MNSEKITEKQKKRRCQRGLKMFTENVKTGSFKLDITVFYLEMLKESPWLKQIKVPVLFCSDPWYNEDSGITNDILQPSNSTIYGKEPNGTNSRKIGVPLYETNQKYVQRKFI